MADIFARFQIRFPNMPCYQFDVVFAFRTLRKIRTSCTGSATTFVFTVSAPVRGTIRQYLIIRADVTVIMLIIYILVFSEKALFSHRSFIRQQRTDPVIYQQFCYRRCFITCICYQGFYSDVFYLVIQCFEGSAVVLIPRMYTIAKDPAVLIAGCLYCISKYIFMFTLSEPSAFRIRGAFLDVFFFLIPEKRQKVPKTKKLALLKEKSEAETSDFVYSLKCASFRCALFINFLMQMDFPSDTEVFSADYNSNLPQVRR